jgi:hypothetical protein
MSARIAKNRQAPRRKSFVTKDRSACMKAVRQVWLDEGRVAQTVRNYFYRLLALGVIKLLDMPNSKLNAYKFTSRLLTEARQSGVLPWGAVIDTERGGMGSWAPSRSFRSSIEYSGSGYTVDVWRGQPRRVEVWTEHKGLAASLFSVTRNYRIPVNVTKGYDSQSQGYEKARRYGNGAGWTLLYIGDHDATGLDIERAFEQMLAQHGCSPEIVRVAITEDQIPELDPTAAEPVPAGDSRGAAYIARHGPFGYQAEAMRTSALHEKLRDAITTYVDVDELTAALAIEDAASEYVTSIIEVALEHVGDEVMDEGVPDLHYLLSVQRFYLGEQGEYPERPLHAAYPDGEE